VVDDLGLGAAGEGQQQDCAEGAAAHQTRTRGNTLGHCLPPWKAVRDSNVAIRSRSKTMQIFWNVASLLFFRLQKAYVNRPAERRESFYCGAQQRGGRSNMAGQRSVDITNEDCKILQIRTGGRCIQPG